MFSLFYSLLWNICNYDWKYFIKYITKYNMFPKNTPFPSRESVVNYFSDKSLFENLSEKNKKIIIYELQNIKGYFKRLHGVDRNFTRQNLQKQIFDYECVIQDLKNQAFNYRTKLLSTDSIDDIQTFENYTQAWADIQSQIIFLSGILKKFKKQLNPE